MKNDVEVDVDEILAALGRPPLAPENLGLSQDEYDKCSLGELAVRKKKWFDSWVGTLSEERRQKVSRIILEIMCAKDKKFKKRFKKDLKRRYKKLRRA